jgi:hypothetical protein
MKIGHVVAFYCNKHGKYVRMNDKGDLDVSGKVIS